MIKDDPLLDGVTFSGGEPFCQCRALIALADRIRKEYPRFGIMSYTGFTFEELLERNTPENGYVELLKRLDGLVDGPFILEQRNLALKFRGSINQRIIDVRKSLTQGGIQLWSDPFDA